MLLHTITKFTRLFKQMYCTYVEGNRHGSSKQTDLLIFVTFLEEERR